MAKKEINVFSVSFIDLLSGALGAILILFVIVPKMDSKIRAQLEELKTYQQLELDVTDIENMMVKLEASVPKEVLSETQGVIDEMKAQVNAVSKSLNALNAEIKALQVELGKCDERKKEIETELASTKKRIEELEKRISSNDNNLGELSAENTKLKSQVEALQAARSKLDTDLVSALEKKTNLEKTQDKIQDQVQAKTQEVIRKEAEMKQLQKEIEKLKQQNKELKTQVAEASKNSGTEEDRTGVKFSDKNIVFVLDVSGSMEADPEPQKLADVKAGIKMLIATMDEKFKIDIVIFPESPTKDFKYLYGDLKPVTEDLKYTVYRQLNKLYARNCTPTRSVMDFVFSHPAYKNAGNITFLSDGLPTISEEGSTDCPGDPSRDVLSFIKKLNGGKKTINTIGVGKDYRTSSSSDPKVKFMKDMARQNGGFYIGF